MAVADYLELVTQRVQDTDSRLSSGDIDRALRAAVVRFSEDQPRLLPVDVVSTGNNTLPLPVGFDLDFSDVASIEYPVGEFPPVLLDNDSFGLLQIPGGKELRLAAILPLGATVRLTWTNLHVLDGVTDTIPATRRDAVADWAASLLCHDLATLYSGDSDPTIRADSVDHNSKSREYAARSRTLAQRYWDALGIDPKRNNAAGTVINMTVTPSHGGARLTHRRGFYRGT